MSTIIGKKFVISTKHPRTDKYKVRTVLITNEFMQDGKRMYEVKERGRKPFSACAEAYDKLFSVERGVLRPKGYKGKVGGNGLKVND